jgi:DNA-binding NtrC family response regulator
MKSRILLVDDEPRWINFAQDDLAKFEIVVARDAATALAELAADRFDLVIVSSRRLDVLKIISQKHPDKRVIVMTIQPTNREALTAYRLGAMRYLPKSFGNHDLLHRVEEIIPNLAKSARV